MAIPYTQADLLSLLQTDQSHFTTVITRLSDEEQLRPFTEEGWSVKDCLDHMAHWVDATNQVLLAYLQGRPLPAPIPSGDEANVEQRLQDTARPLQQTRIYWEEVHATLQHLVQTTLDDARLIERVRHTGSAQHTEMIGNLIPEILEHSREHFDLIKHEVLDRL